MIINHPVETRISVLHPITRLIVGGAQENTMFTAALLDKRRFDVEVLCGPQTGSEGSIIEEVRDRNIPLTILPELVREVNPFKDLSALWKLYRLMRSNGFTIVHTHSSKAGVLGRIAARLAGTPIIVHTVHGWSFHDHMAPLTKKIYVTLERLAAAFTDAMIVVAERDIRKGQKEGIGRRGQFHLIRSAIPLDEFQPDGANREVSRAELGLPQNVPVLGNVGRFSPQKNPLDWIKIAGILGNKLPDCHFLLVGDGPMRVEVENELAAQKISDRTILTGLRRDVPNMMAAMDVFLLTSLWEGLPRVIPQAMAMRLPIVAYRVDGTAEIIQNGETGYLCTPGKISGVADHCLNLLSNPALRLQLGQNGRELATREFNVQHMVNQIANLYEDLLKTHSAKTPSTN
jgi:glycosyltransferase involved in cell wall biosynthesis